MIKHKINRSFTNNEQISLTFYCDHRSNKILLPTYIYDGDKRKVWNLFS